MNPTDCPKFNGCSAPICPLDADWRKRTHLDGERACFFLSEYGKPAALPTLRRVLPDEHLQALVKVYPEVIARPGPLKKQLKRAAENPPRIGCKPGDSNRGG